MKKSLHETEYLRILEVLSRNGPMSGKKIVDTIEKLYPGSGSRYIYERINELTPQNDEDHGVRLFGIQDQFNTKLCKKIVRKLKSAFQNLDFKDLKTHSSYLKENATEKKIIELKDTNGRLIKIEIDKGKESVTLTAPFVSEYSKIPLLTKRKQGNLYYYTLRKRDRSNRTFLNISYDKKIVMKFSNSRSSVEDEKIRNKAQSNKRYWLYDLNLRSCMLYSSSNVTTKDIEQMLTNISKRINATNDSSFPFLINYNTWKKTLPRFFITDRIKRISILLENRLDEMRVEDLNENISSYLYDEVTDYLFSVFNDLNFKNSDRLLSNSIFQYISHQTDNLNEYDRLKILKRKFLKGESERIHKLEN